MIIDCVRSYYGDITQDASDYLQNNVESLDDEKQSDFFSWLKENHKKNKGSPTVTTLSKAYFAVTGNKTRRYFWCVCKECGEEYGYGMPLCPVCYNNGKQSNSYAVRVSDMKPPFKVVRYNKRYIGDGSEQTCYTCANRDMSYCSHFGQPDWQCNDSEWRQCKCASCCLKEKKSNIEWKKQIELRKK